MTEDEVKELSEQVDELGGSKYVNSFDVICCNHDMSILFSTHAVLTTCVTISYKACHKLIELLQESLDNAKSKEIKPNAGTALKEALLKGVSTANAQSAIDTLTAMGYTYEGGVRWKPPLGKPRYDNLTGFEG